MAYLIKTLDGVVVRKTATRPYVEALIFRNADTNEVLWGDQMSSKAKHSNGQLEKTGFTFTNKIPFVAKWETVVAIDRAGK